MYSESRTFLALGSSIILGLALLWFGYKRFYCRKKLGKRAVVKELYLYPVKSCAGIKLDKVEIEKVGLLLDRTWVLVNSKGIFQSMRQRPKLALVKPSFEGKKYLCIDAPGMPTLKLDIDVNDDDKAEKRLIDIFYLHGEGIDCGDEAGKWFDTFLGKTGHRLFSGRHKSLKHRLLKEDQDWADTVEEGDQMIFPDVCPIMMVSEASLEAVNQELEDRVDIRSFRPNIFIEGCSPFEEDEWNSVKIGDVLLRKLRHCSRCILTTVDMDKGIKRANGEPLKTLMRIRVFKDQDKRYNEKPLFGNLFVADVLGTINVGDDVTVLA